MKADKMLAVFRLLLRAAGNHSKIPDRMATTRAIVGRIDLDTDDDAGTEVADIVRIVQIVRISVADTSRTRRLSRRRMTVVPTTSRDSPNNLKHYLSLICYLPGDGASTGSNAGTRFRFSRRAGIAR